MELRSPRTSHSLCIVWCKRLYSFAVWDGSEVYPLSVKNKQSCNSEITRFFLGQDFLIGGFGEVHKDLVGHLAARFVSKAEIGIRTPGFPSSHCYVATVDVALIVRKAFRTASSAQLLGNEVTDNFRWTLPARIGLALASPSAGLLSLSQLQTVCFPSGRLL
jgi:hypothetical protein